MGMHKSVALRTAGVVFGLVALFHLLRIFFHTEVSVSGHVLSIQISYIGFIVALILSIWMFVASSR